MKKIIIVLFLLGTVYTYSQDLKFNYSNALLTDVLVELEEKYNVRFSYKSSLLKDVKITSKETTNFTNYLDYLALKFKLEFIFLDDENIVVKKAKNDIYLENQLNEIIIITEYLTSGFDKNKEDGSITLNPNKLGVLPGLTEPDILQSLQLLPGIFSPEETAANLHIRGGTPDQNLILYDGIKVYHQGHLFGMITPFNPYIVESVDVFRSGAKAKYGDRISGIIDIKSYNEISNDFSAGAGFNLLHSDVYAQFPIIKDKVSAQFSARTSINYLIKQPTFTSFRDKLFQNTAIENSIQNDDEATVLDDTFQFTDLNAKLIIAPNKKNKITLSALSVENSLDYRSETDDSEEEKYGLDVNNVGTNLDWQYKISNNFLLTNSLKFSKLTSNYNSETNENGNLVEKKTSSNVVRDFGFVSEVNYQFKEDLLLNFGYEFSNYNIDYDLQFVEDETISEFQNTVLNTHSLFGEFNGIFKKWKSRVGLRASYYDNINRFFLEPRFYISYDFTNDFKLKASYEIKNQPISQLLSFEFNDLGFGNSIWTLSDNDEIPVLNNQQVTFGFFYQKNGWKIDVDSYYKKIKGLSSFTRGFTVNLNTNDDYVTGNSNIFGVDVLLKKKIKSFRTWLAYSYSKNTFEFLDLQATRFPGNFDQTHVISWSNTYKYKQFNFALGYQFATGKPFSNDASIQNDEIVFNQQNNARLKSFQRLDMSVFYDFYYHSNKKIKSRIGLSLNNILNRANEIDKSLNIEEDNNLNTFLEEEINFGLGFTPNLVFRVYF